MLYQEDEREILTNEGIRADLKRDIVSELLQSMIAVLAIALLIVCCAQLARLSPENPILFWFFAILAGVLSFLQLCFIVSEIMRAISYASTFYHNKFEVSENKLVSKKNGRGSAGNLFLNLTGMGLLALFYLPKANSYEFVNGTYTVAMGAPHYRRSKRFAMNGETLFSRSHIDDFFWVVSLKAGKLVKIYPQDLFDYKDSSPL